MDEDGWSRLNLRIPVELKEWLRQQAFQTRRSYNAEVVVAIEQYRGSKEKAATGELPRA